MTLAKARTSGRRTIAPGSSRFSRGARSLRREGQGAAGPRAGLRSHTARQARDRFDAGPDHRESVRPQGSARRARRSDTRDGSRADRRRPRLLRALGAPARARAEPAHRRRCRARLFGHSRRWSLGGELAAFGAGKITAAQLASFAATATQKTEAAFYAAMDARVAGQKDPGDAALRSVLRGGGIDLMEVVIARELIRGAAGARRRARSPLASRSLEDRLTSCARPCLRCVRRSTGAASPAAPPRARRG